MGPSEYLSCPSLTPHLVPSQVNVSVRPFREIEEQERMDRLMEFEPGGALQEQLEEPIDD